MNKAAESSRKQPQYYPSYNNLALGYARRARETSDIDFYRKAEEALRKSFALSPDNFEGMKVRAWVELGRHEFAKALETAKALNERAPDDLTVYGYLADANAELGNYQAAVAAAQWMLDLRPGNIPGLTRAAFLRELHGELAGALELMTSAYESTLESEIEDRAWLLTQMSHIQLLRGDAAKAEALAQRALAAFPDYHYALGMLAQVRIAQMKYDDAVELLSKRYRTAAHPENLFALAEALKLAGRETEAATAFAEFEKRSAAESGTADNSNHELILYYVDHAHLPEKALEVASMESGRRQDAFTLDCLAWALAANGRYAEAHATMKRAQSFGVKDPRIAAHAEAIRGWLLEARR